MNPQPNFSSSTDALGRAPAYGGGMKRASVFVVIAILVAACEGTPASQNPDQSQAEGASQAPATDSGSGGGGGGGGGGDLAALAEAAAAITDWCTVMPADLVAELVPGAADLVTAEFPSSCTATNQVQALQVSYQGFAGSELPPGMTSIPGLGESAWLEPSYPVDDAYLTVILYTDPDGLGASTIWVEMASDDGVDYSDQTIAFAQALIAQLQ